MRTHSIFTGASCCLTAVLCILAASLCATAQTSPTSAIDANDMLQLHRMPGKLLAQGANLEPVGEVKLRSYVLEELNLARPVRVDINGQVVETPRVWRLTITGGPFPIRAMPAVIWLDDKPAGEAAESPDLSRLSVIIFDQTLLREGATISISYGRNDPDRIELPEKLKLTAGK